ncbi:MAG: HAD family hydrolase [Ilyomonas sp.]
MKTEEQLTKEKIDCCKAVIFDMDGTLIASTEGDYLAWKMLFEEHGKELSFEKYIPLMGVKSAEVAHKHLDLSGEALHEALRKKLVYFEDIIDEKGIHAIPYAKDFLEHLKTFPVKLALATSSRKNKMEMVMQRLHLLDFFDAVVVGEEVENGKPAPDVFIKTAKKLAIEPSACIVIEDAASGVKAAKNANMKCIAITTTNTRDALNEADIIVDSFKDLKLPEICKKLYSH